MKLNKWIDFGKPYPSLTGKTKIWEVETSGDSFCVGEIKWHGAWRRYAFFPERDTMFEQQCLRTIADFCEEQTKAHRKK